jgi:hypothetical protein
MSRRSLANVLVCAVASPLSCRRSNPKALFRVSSG